MEYDTEEAIKSLCEVITEDARGIEAEKISALAQLINARANLELVKQRYGREKGPTFLI